MFLSSRKSRGQGIHFSFIGISQSIMATSYVKMIDIWMIFTMVRKTRHSKKCKYLYWNLERRKMLKVRKDKRTGTTLEGDSFSPSRPSRARSNQPKPPKQQKRTTMERLKFS